MDAPSEGWAPEASLQGGDDVRGGAREASGPDKPKKWWRTTILDDQGSSLEEIDCGARTSV